MTTPVLRQLWLSLVLVALTAAPAALAYRPPARVLLQKAMERQIDRATRSLKVEADVQVFEGGLARGAPVAERSFFQAPASARKELEGAEGQRIEIRVEDKVLLKGPGQNEKPQKAPADLLFDAVTVAPPLDDTRAVERLLKDMRALGINPEVVSFARFDGRIAYLIGSKPWETDKAQLWLDKETLLITRVVSFPKVDGRPVKNDVRYLGWGSAVGGNWYPATIEHHVDDMLQRRAITRTVDRNVAIDATLLQLR